MLYDEQKEALIQGLYAVAENYFNDPSTIDPDFGICYQLDTLMQGGYAYRYMRIVMEDMGELTGYFTPSRQSTIEEWEQRAYMCLLLIEHLKTDVYVPATALENLVEAPVTTLVEKVVNVVKNIRKSFGKGGNVCTN